ncbi:MAG: hypothetical protein Q4A15_03155 [Prevotellaceae bacterium]|nr:hypothetical protein [Prevotellaceae bacterium]
MEINKIKDGIKNWFNELENNYVQFHNYFAWCMSEEFDDASNNQDDSSEINLLDLYQPDLNDGIQTFGQYLLFETGLKYTTGIIISGFADRYTKEAVVAIEITNEYNGQHCISINTFETDKLSDYKIIGVCVVNCSDSIDIDLPDTVQYISIYRGKLGSKDTNNRMMSIKIRNDYYTSENGCLYELKDGKPYRLIHCCNLINPAHTNYCVPDSVEEISEGALQNIKFKGSLTFPESLTKFTKKQLGFRWKDSGPNLIHFKGKVSTLDIEGLLGSNELYVNNTVDGHITNGSLLSRFSKYRFRIPELLTEDKGDFMQLTYVEVESVTYNQLYKLKVEHPTYRQIPISIRKENVAYFAKVEIACYTDENPDGCHEGTRIMLLGKDVGKEIVKEIKKNPEFGYFYVDVYEDYKTVEKLLNK